MKSLAERHEDRLMRAELTAKNNGFPLLRSNEATEEPFVLGADGDGFPTAVTGVINSNHSMARDVADVVDHKGEIDPVQGDAAAKASAAADGFIADQEAAAKAAAEAGDPHADSNLAWGSTAKGVAPGMPEGSRADAKAQAQGDKPASK